MPGTSSLPPRFADRTLDGFHASSPTATKALAAARRLVDGELRNLVLAGPTGVGKTHLAAGIVAAVSARLQAAYVLALGRARESHSLPLEPRYPEWTNVADAVTRLRLEMDAPLDDRIAGMRLRRLASYPGLVVLDDLGREKVTDWTGEVVYTLVNGRYEAMLPTVVTTNLTRSDLADSAYWPAISRLAEDGALVAIEAEDRRLRRMS
jgi:DNA replication protein DnaC